MKHNIADILDMCIEAMRRGQTQEECLATYPDAAPTLLPLIQTAVAIGQRPKVQADAARMSAGKTAFLHEAARLRQAQQQHAAKPWQRLALIANATFALPRRPALGAIRGRSLAWTPALSLILALALVLGTATTAIAAGRSLPDEPLYSVKLAGEQVQAALTLDPVARADLALELAQKRLDEITALTTLGRPVSAPSIERLTAESSGALNSIGRIKDDDMTPRLQRYLAMVVQQQALLLQVNGVSAIADTISAALAIAEENEKLATTAISNPSVLKETPPQRTNRGAVPAPKDTATSVPTPDVRQMRTPAPAQTPAPSATATAAPPTPANTATQPPAPTATHTVTPPTATVAPTAAATIQFSDVIERISPSQWVVGGRTLRISAQTKIGGAPAQVSARADVTAAVEANQALVALAITVHPVAEQPGNSITVRGIIFSMNGTAWNIGGQSVTVNASTQIQGAPAPGMIAQASAVRSNNAVVAAIITVVGPAPETQIRGQIERITPQNWVIGGQSLLLVQGLTTISGSAEVGKNAAVTALRQDNGALIARQITIVAAVSEEEFEGMINRIDGNMWTISGRRVLRNQGTQVDETLGKAQVGQRARVRGTMQPDGVIHAISIRILAAGSSGRHASPTVAPPAVTPTPTRTPPARPSASPTAPTSPLATATPTAAIPPASPTSVVSLPATPTCTVVVGSPTATATPGLPMRTRTPGESR